MKLYTIGHGNLDIDPFINILRANNVYWVADVRSSPYSRRFPQFSRGGLSAALKREGIKYLFVGDKLGGKPMEGESTPGWRQGRLSYELVSTLSRTKRWAEGIEYLSTVIKTMSEQGETGCLLCSEKNPNNCHRAAIAFDLANALADLDVQHLAHDSEPTEAKFQKTLFAVPDERADYH